MDASTIAHDAVIAIDLDKLKSAVNSYLNRSDTFTEESALRMFRATLAIEAKRTLVSGPAPMEIVIDREAFAMSLKDARKMIRKHEDDYAAD